MKKKKTVKKKSPAGEPRFKIWLDRKNKVIHINVFKQITEQIMEQLAEKVIPLLKRAHGKGKMYVYISQPKAQLLRSSKARKRILNLIKDIEKIGFEKMAFFAKSSVIKAILSFIIIASRFKNIKMFKTEKEALEWLKGK